MPFGKWSLDFYGFLVCPHTDPGAPAAPLTRGLGLLLAAGEVPIGGVKEKTLAKRSSRILARDPEIHPPLLHTKILWRQQPSRLGEP